MPAISILETARGVDFSLIFRVYLSHARQAVEGEPLQHLPMYASGESRSSTVGVHGLFVLGETMKKLRWTYTAEAHAHMKEMQRINRVQCQKSPSEAWMADKLTKTSVKWTRQAQWGYRLFDFWSAKLGIAVEVDGPEHKKEYDAYRDEYNYRRSGIIVLRVRNMSEEDAQKALLAIASCKEDWQQRRKSMGIEGSKKQKSRLADMPYTDGQRMAGASI